MKPKTDEINKGKQRIIDAAIEVIKEKGVTETSVRDIAAKAGITTGSIYHHYKNREEVLFDVLHKTLHISPRISNNPSTKTKNREDVLAEICDGIKERFLKKDEQRFYILLLIDVIAKNNELKDRYADYYKNILKDTGDLFYYAFGIENEKMKKAVASILVMALDGFAIQQSLEAFPENTEEMIRVFIEFFSESIPVYLEKHNIDYSKPIS